MALINRPMYEHFAARHLAVKGPGALTSIEEGVMGVLPLDMSSDPAYWFVQGIRTYAVYKSVGGGGAGQYAKAGISIENESEEIIVKLLRIDVDFGAAAAKEATIYRCARTAFSSDPGVYGKGTDTRIAEAQPSMAVCISADSAATPGSNIGYWQTDAVPFMSTDQLPYIISPGEAIYVRNNTTNEQFVVTFVWAEIPAYKAEL
jgi:hypothetical protein